jgi:3-dehydroquinate dehydratase-2
MKRILVINGPNLNFLGQRERDVYGSETLDEINGRIISETDELDIELDFFQSNHEGDLIDEIQFAHYNEVDGIVLNAGAFTHYSYAIRDAIASVDVPVAEVHLSDVNSREDFRKISVIREVCAASFFGEGYVSYMKAVCFLDKQNEGEQK